MPLFVWGLLLKPLVALLVLVLAAYAKYAVERRMKDGKLKRLLLRRIGS